MSEVAEPIKSSPAPKVNPPFAVIKPQKVPVPNATLEVEITS